MQEQLDMNDQNEAPAKGLLSLVRKSTQKFVRLDSLEPGEMFIVSLNACAPWVVLDDRNRQTTLIANLKEGEHQRLANSAEVMRVRGNMEWWVI